MAAVDRRCSAEWIRPTLSQWFRQCTLIYRIAGFEWESPWGEGTTDYAYEPPSSHVLEARVDTSLLVMLGDAQRIRRDIQHRPSDLPTLMYIEQEVHRNVLISWFNLVE